MDVTVKAPALPTVPEVSERYDPSLFVITEADAPIAAVLIASARPASVFLGEAGTLIDCAALVPTWIEIEPESRSFALAIVARVALEAVELDPAVTEEPSGLSLIAVMLDVTVKPPPDDPSVCDANSSVDSPLLVTTLAVTPKPAAKMLGFTVNVPALPGVPEVKAKVATPSAAVVTAAETPIPAEVMALASPESVLTPLPV